MDILSALLATSYTPTATIINDDGPSGVVASDASMSQKSPRPSATTRRGKKLIHPTLIDYPSLKRHDWLNPKEEAAYVLWEKALAQALAVVWVWVWQLASVRGLRWSRRHEYQSASHRDLASARFLCRYQVMLGQPSPPRCQPCYPRACWAQEHLWARSSDRPRQRPTRYRRARARSRLKASATFW